MFRLHSLKLLQHLLFLLLVWILSSLLIFVLFTLMHLSELVDMWWKLYIYFLKWRTIIGSGLLMGFDFCFVFVVVNEWEILISNYMLVFSCWEKNTASDYYQFDDLLSPEEQALRMKVRECMENEVAPIMTEVFFFFLCCSWTFVTTWIHDGSYRWQLNAVTFRVKFLFIYTFYLHVYVYKESNWLAIFLSVLGEGGVSIRNSSETWDSWHCWFYYQGSSYIDFGF